MEVSGLEGLWALMAAVVFVNRSSFVTVLGGFVWRPDNPNVSPTGLRREP